MKKEIIVIISTAVISAFISMLLDQLSLFMVFVTALFAMASLFIIKKHPKSISILLTIWILFFVIFSYVQYQNTNLPPHEDGDTFTNQEKDNSESSVEEYKYELLTEAQNLENEGKIIDAINILNNRNMTILGDDTDVINKITELEDTFREQVLIDAESKLNSEGYESAISSLQYGLSVLPGDPVLISKVDEYSDYKPKSLLELEFFNASSKYPYNIEQSIKFNDGSEYINGLSILPSIRSSTTNWFEYKIDGTYSSFSGTLGLGYSYRTTKYTNQILIYGDNILIYSSPIFTNGVEPTSFKINISGITYLKIECIGEYSYDSDNARVYLVDTYLTK